MLACLAIPLASCSGGSGAASSTTASPTPATVTSVAPATEPMVSETTETADALGTIAPVPETGVPGIDSNDPFCNAWSRFAGSFQALAFASNLGDPDDAIRLEVAASDAVVVAVADLDAAFPGAVAAERGAFLDELLGPFAARAGSARGALLAAGLSAEQVSALGVAWLAAVTDAGFNDLGLTVVIPPDVQGQFDAAVDSFASATPPIAADPSLVTDASAPSTESYIAANCPDQGILAGNDIVGD